MRTSPASVPCMPMRTLLQWQAAFTVSSPPSVTHRVHCGNRSFPGVCPLPLPDGHPFRWVPPDGLPPPPAAPTRWCLDDKGAESYHDMLLQWPQHEHLSDGPRQSRIPTRTKRRIPPCICSQRTRAGSPPQHKPGLRRYGTGPTLPTTHKRTCHNTDPTHQLTHADARPTSV